MRCIWKLYSNNQSKAKGAVKKSNNFIHFLALLVILQQFFSPNFGPWCQQSIVSSSGPSRRRHISLEPHNRIPKTLHPQGRTCRCLHTPWDLLSLPGRSPCLPLPVQRTPWSRGCKTRTLFYSCFPRQPER